MYPRFGLATILALTPALHAQSETRDAPLADKPAVAAALELIQQWMDAQIDYDSIPGVSVSIVHDQEVLWSGGFGYADLEGRVPAESNTIYSICSISKLFTSIAVMQLRDQGKVRLTDPIANYLPWFQLLDRFPDAPPATLVGVMTHSAGLPREADYPYWTGPDYDFPTRAQIMEAVSKQEELYPADTTYQYSNLGLTLAGEVVAAVSGQEYASYVNRNVLGPLGMKDTTPEIPQALRGGQLATPYSRRLRDGTRKEIDYYPVRGIAPAAGYASTVDDLARFASWQMRLLDGEDAGVLQPNTLREMHRVRFLDDNWQTARGLGFSVSRRDGKTFVGHGGSCPGYRSVLTLSPKDKVAVAFMTNGHDVSPGTYANPILDLVIDAIKDADKPDKEVDPALQQYVGTYERPLGGETLVRIIDGGLVTLSLPSRNPGSLTKLEHVGPHTFRRKRDDDRLGEKFVFTVNADGEVERMVRNSNYSIRVR